MVAAAAVGIAAIFTCDDARMRTAVVSDLHLGHGAGADLLRRPAFVDRLLEAVDGVDRLVLLGDVVEMRDIPLSESIAVARPLFARLADALAGAEIVIVGGNHDHHLVERWLEDRALGDAAPLELEHRFEPTGGAIGELAAAAAGCRVVAAYPGLWLRDDVYATHGHFLDRHLTVPTFERMGIGVVERLLGIPPDGPDPLDPPENPEQSTIEDYERVQAPVYSFLTALAESGGSRRGGANPSARVWEMVGGGESRSARLRGWLLGSVAVPGAVGVANRLGIGPVRSDLSPGAVTRAGVVAMSEVVERLRIDADHVVFGHTHRRGPIGAEPGWDSGGTRLWNTGSWVHSPPLLRSTAAESPYWPGTIGLLGDEGEPELRHLLDDLGREDLGAGELDRTPR